MIAGKLVRVHGRRLCCLGLWFLVLPVLVLDTRAQGTGAPGRSSKRAKCVGSSAEVHDGLDGVTLGAALQGRIPGVNVVRVGGGRTGIAIRGGSALEGRQPLVYVDGVRVSNLGPTGGLLSVSLFEYVNPSDVRRIEVLRGPAATMRYGSGAADGVILIITKRGVDEAGSEVEPPSHCNTTSSEDPPST